MCPLVNAGCVCLRRVRVEILSIRASVQWFLPDEIHRHPVTLTTQHTCTDSCFVLPSTTCRRSDHTRIATLSKDPTTSWAALSSAQLSSAQLNMAGGAPKADDRYLVHHLYLDMLSTLTKPQLLPEALPSLQSPAAPTAGPNHCPDRRCKCRHVWGYI
jgi:hypothetical protein